MGFQIVGKVQGLKIQGIGRGIEVLRPYSAQHLASYTPFQNPASSAWRQNGVRIALNLVNPQP